MIINLSCGSFKDITCNGENYYWSLKAHSRGAIATAIFLLAVNGLFLIHCKGSHDDRNNIINPTQPISKS